MIFNKNNDIINIYNINKKEGVNMPAQHYVICKHCGVRFNRDKEEAVKISANRYVHKTCYDDYIKGKDKDEGAKRRRPYAHGNPDTQNTTRATIISGIE